MMRSALTAWALAFAFRGIVPAGAQTPAGTVGDGRGITLKALRELSCRRL